MEKKMGEDLELKREQNGIYEKLSEYLIEDRMGNTIKTHDIAIYSQTDARLTIRSPVDDSVGVLRGTLKDVGNVEYIKIPQSHNMNLGGKELGQAEIYRYMTLTTRMQNFYGVLQYHSSKYAIMEDLSGELTLGSAINDGKFPSSMSVTLRIVYEIADAMASLHAAKIVIKSLSDESIILKKTKSGNFIPVMTQLMEARRVPDTPHYLRVAKNIVS
jgi:serine/threonine protein kinase